MVNRQRGEIAAVIDGRRCVLKLTLGALVELEEALETPDLVALAERFEAGRPAARDVRAVVRAGFHGMGEDVSVEQVDAMAFEDGLIGAYRIAGELLAAAFVAKSDR